MVDGEEEEELHLDVIGEWAECGRRVAVEEDDGERNPKGEGGGGEGEESVGGVKVHGEVVALERGVEGFVVGEDH